MEMITGFNVARDPYKDYNPLPAEPLYHGSSTDWDGEGDPLIELDEAQAKRVAELIEGSYDNVPVEKIPKIDRTILAQIYREFPHLNPNFQAAEPRSHVLAHPCECGLEVSPHYDIKQCVCGRAYDSEGRRVAREDGIPFILQD